MLCNETPSFLGRTQRLDCRQPRLGKELRNIQLPCRLSGKGKKRGGLGIRVKKVSLEPGLNGDSFKLIVRLCTDSAAGAP